MIREKNKYYPVAFKDVTCPHCGKTRDRIKCLTIGTVIWCEDCGKTFDLVDKEPESCPALPSDRILKNFWYLCSYYKHHVNDGLCDIVFDSICRYSRAYMERTGCPILVFEECPELIERLKKEGLQ